MKGTTANKHSHKTHKNTSSSSIGWCSFHLKSVVQNLLPTSRYFSLLFCELLGLTEGNKYVHSLIQ
ncbi:hypothetical protein C9994_03900 [Marivirga lumbricoides]|uniref:Uncharacterized protein n=1 Tax=Marivirga lumbricoides TaxID=1046115 RepID=A0A2T4DTR5_9BACT|nr:hypothetical protein C9994_03900 [Marivirga lumbricoides]